MKSLLSYIINEENSNQHKVTEQWMKDKYDEFNHLYFDDKLGDSDKVDFKVKKLKSTTLGCQGFDKKFWYYATKYGERYGMYVMRNKDNKEIEDVYAELHPHIYMNSDMRFTETEMEDTLIHEMIHLYTYQDGLAPKRAHGKEFQHMCAIIREKAKKNGKNYHLTTKAESNHGQNFSLSDLAQQDVDIKKNKKLQSAINRCAMIYIKMRRADSKGNLYRFMFLAKNSVDKMVTNIYNSINSPVDEVYVNLDAGDIYEDVTKNVGKFGFVKALKSGRYYFWNANDYLYIKKKIEEGIHKRQFVPYDKLNESLTIVNEEGKKKYIKPETIVISIPANTDLSELNLEDVVKIFKKDMEANPQSDKEIEQNMKLS